MDARQILPFWVFLTCFWPFPVSSSTLKKAVRAAKRETRLVIVKVKWLLVLEILVLVVVVVIVEVAMIRDEVDGWMLGKCSLFGVSDLFLTCFWPFPVSSLTSKKVVRAAKRETLLVIVKVKWLLVFEILVLVLLVVVIAAVVVVAVAAVAAVGVGVVVVEVAMIRDEVDGRMDARQVLPFWYFWLIPDLFLTFLSILFNFKKSSTGSQMRNAINNSQSKIITSTRNTSISTSNISSSNSSNTSNNRSSNDKKWAGSMDGC